jgi:hypothetical protein
VPVRPDRGRGGDEDLLAHSYGSAETDDGLQRGA